jgi:hypothetical protein
MSGKPTTQVSGLRQSRFRAMGLLTLITVAVGTTIADRPPHRSVQARLRVRFYQAAPGGIEAEDAGMPNEFQEVGSRSLVGLRSGVAIASLLN